jgi:hypothetical protein
VVPYAAPSARRASPSARWRSRRTTGCWHRNWLPGIARVKSATSIGVRSGNWFTPRQAPGASERAGHHDDQGLRDRAVIAVLLRCGGFTPEATVAVHGTRIRRFLTLSALQRDSCNTAGWQGGIRRITA